MKQNIAKGYYFPVGNLTIDIMYGTAIAPIVYGPKNDYKNAIEISNSIVDHLDEVPLNMKMFINVFYWRNLGFAYDMLRKRKEAIVAYKECKKMCIQFNLNEDMANNIYIYFENEPYQK